MVFAHCGFPPVEEMHCSTGFPALPSKVTHNLTFFQAPWSIDDKKPGEGWPTKGEVELSNYSIRYRPGLDLVLKNLSLKVKGGEKVKIQFSIPYGRFITII